MLKGTNIRRDTLVDTGSEMFNMILVEKFPFSVTKEKNMIKLSLRKTRLP